MPASLLVPWACRDRHLGRAGHGMKGVATEVTGTLEVQVTLHAGSTSSEQRTGRVSSRGLSARADCWRTRKAVVASLCRLKEALIRSAHRTHLWMI